MRIPPIDLVRAHQRIAQPLAERWQRLLENTSFVLGPEVGELEKGFAEAVGAAGCVAVANGTDALLIALRALGVGPGDEVLVPAFSFFATAEVVVLAGARPIFVDVDPKTLNLDPADASSRITPRTVGLIGVHLYGRPFDVAAVEALCARHGLWLVEDAAQAHGASWNERKVGTLGQLAAWSFYPTKNLGCFGDGGALTGPDAELLARARRLANHGQAGRYHHLEVGTNSRLDSLQAAVLNCRLPLLAGDNQKRREIACRYHGGLVGVGDLAMLEDGPGYHCVYHQYTVRTARRDELQAHLNQAGILAAVHYPSPLHRQSALAFLGEPPELPVAEAAAREVLCLPIFPELTNEEVERVIASTRQFFGA
ncbi:MAG TPA: DegT/DnrJ/EryC1/StrS family aminotransferase [Thermoanaerobaculia bacterium]|nr:DegT/DnrJ/EryC1/StrS family aminotransferase [Thermoanaerobaculia bacterium]